MIYKIMTIRVQILF